VRKTLQLPYVFTLSLLAFAQPSAAKRPVPTATPAIKRSGPAERTESPVAAQFPVTRVALYKNGVGFFEHDGHVTGDQSVSIDFTTAQLDDVLQSLTAIDLNGGRIAGADYNSTMPLDQQLKALPLSLGDKVTLSGLFTKLRGARVQVSGTGASFTGRIVDIEMHKTGSGKQADGMTEGRFLTLVSDSGDVRIVSITPAVTVHLLDDRTATDLTQFLKVLDSGRTDGLRHLTIEDHGMGTRELHVSYISEVPIWKSTYRILFTDPPNSSARKPQTATLQGWSVVDNTTGEDWNDIQLSLIAGAPQSFIQPLSVPYYSRRPEMPLPHEAQLSPQTHESGDVVQNKSMGSGSGSGMGAGVAGGMAPQRVDTRSATLGGSIQNQMYSNLPLAMDGNSAIYGGAGAENLNENYVEAMPVTAARLGGSYQSLAASSIVPNATTAAFDDYFAYNLTEPITIRKNESALVPTIQTKVDAERVTLWSTSQPVPLRALWITNTSALTLDRGSFTIIEDGNFAGEGLLDPIHPAEKRLLSYAVDQAIHVTSEQNRSSVKTVSISAAKGVFSLHSVDHHEVTYVIHNAAAEARTVVLEEPFVRGFTLDSETPGNSDPRPVETTPSVYRFHATIPAGETVRLHSGATRPGINVYQLSNFNDSQLTYILSQSGGGSDLIRQALEPILDARRRVADSQTAVDNAKSALDTLHSDEGRQRENITALANADKSSRDRFVRDLNATEDRIVAAQKTLDTAQANLQASRDDLATRIQALQIDQTIESGK
jgi:hypothetical protein